MLGIARVVLLWNKKMYLWVVIATFMVAILSYNLSVRPDIDRAYMETKAQTVIAKFKAQHNALMGYIASKRISLGSEIQTVPYFSGLGYTGEDTGGSGIITGKLSAQAIRTEH